MKLPRIAIDTDVLVAALRSRWRASYRLLSLIGKGKFEYVLSVPLALEYEEIALREIFFLWRPFLRDPEDNMVLEVALKRGAISSFRITKTTLAASRGSD